jgi:DNA-binding response OmpR family regulator
MNVAATVEPVRRLILLVDDDIHLLALLSKMLQLANYDVRIATSAAMALSLLADGGREPDLAILDINMPGMSGLELARQVRANTAIPFLFLSASDAEDSVRSASEQGAVGYLVKPIELNQLLPTVIAGLARGDEIRGLRDNEERLGQALQNGRETGMAVGVVMERFHLDRETAFRVLRDQARSSQRKLNDVAREVLDAAEVLNNFNRRPPEPTRK